MADRGRIPGDMHVAGVLSADKFNLNDGSVGDAEVDGARPISVLKIGHQYIKDVKTVGAVAAKTEPIHVAYGNGTLVAVDAGTVTLCTGSASITIDVQKNGVTVLSTPLILDSGNVARILEAGAIASGAYVSGDWFDVVVTIATPSGAVGTGLIVRLVFREAVA